MSGQKPCVGRETTLRAQFGQVILVAIVGIISLGSSQSLRAQATPNAFDMRRESPFTTPERNFTTPGNEFGDTISRESGALVFNIVDVAIPGNNALPVEFRRILNASEPQKRLGTTMTSTPNSALGDWIPALPKISGTYDSQAGWRTTEPGRATSICSVPNQNYIAPPPGVWAPDAFPARMFWSPPTVQWPNGSSRLLLLNAGFVGLPASGGPYFWVTADFDVVSCLGPLKNQNDASTNPEEVRFGKGEGFLVTRADGVKYFFDWMSIEYKIMSFTTVAQYSGNHGWQTPIKTLEQAFAAIYPTRVEDRFGNWVKYEYSNKANERVKLDRIVASDGRELTIGYENGRIRRVNARGEEWGYFYGLNAGGGGSYNLLSRVELPDGSKWEYSGQSHQYVVWPYSVSHQGRCDQREWMGYVNPDATTVSDSNFSGPLFVAKRVFTEW